MRRLTFLFACLMIAACEQAVEQTTSGSGVALTERMAATPDPGFERAYAPRDFRFPADHGPHETFATEWWYFTGNLSTAQGRYFGYQLTLFRVALKPGAPPVDSDWRAHQLYMGHLAISDLERRRHHSAERFSRAAAGLAGAQIEPLRIWLGPWSISGAPGTTFPLQLRADTPELSLALTLRAGHKPMVLQGERGLSRKSAAPGNASHYYSFTRLPTDGVLHIREQSFQVSGASWLDREWSSSALAADQAGWDWFALQLDDGRELMYYQMRGVDGRPQPFSKGVLVGRDGSVEPLAQGDVELTPVRTWQSDDGARYPVQWTLSIPRLGLQLDVEAAFDDQEMRHTVRYWEGAVRVRGSQSGRGYLELSGYAALAPDGVSDQVAQAVDRQ
jgi:predicted secreted hydrolase